MQPKKIKNEKQKGLTTILKSDFTQEYPRL